jgi:hypothetical protein
MYLIESCMFARGGSTSEFVILQRMEQWTVAGGTVKVRPPSGPGIPGQNP